MSGRLTTRSASRQIKKAPPLVLMLWETLACLRITGDAHVTMHERSELSVLSAMFH